MWHKTIQTYVERHLRFYYDVPLHIKLNYGPYIDDSSKLTIDDSSILCFESSGRTPSFEMMDGIPILFKLKNNTPLIEDKEGQIRLNADLFGAIFFLLSGAQEVWSNISEDRFLLKDSWQGENDFEKLALVDLYFDLLIKAINKAYGVRLAYAFNHPKGIFLSHDIDKLSGGRTEGVFNEIKQGALLKGLSGIIAKKDPWFNLEHIAELEISYGVKSTFFILPEKGKHPLGINADYKIASNRIQNLIKLLKTKGMDIALHGSLGSHNSSTQLIAEKKKIGGEIQGNRFHFLMFNSKKTVKVLTDSALQYDASLGFPDSIGFRRGTSRPFKLFNWETMQISEAVEIPLHAMDTTLHHIKYMGLNPEEALTEINQLYSSVKMHQGVFSLLWHNNYFSEYKYAGWEEIYKAFLANNTKENFYTAKEIANYFSSI